MIKQFLWRILVFVILTLLTVLIICEIQIPDYQIIRLTQNTSYEKIAWDLHIINNEARKINNSSIFIGPSWVQGGINDSMLSSARMKSINMGVNHGGADLDYYLVNRILKYRPKYVFLHRFPGGQGVFHPMMPLLMSPVKYFYHFKNTSLNFFFNFISKRLYFVLKYLIDRVFHQSSAELTSLDSAISNKKYEFGWRPAGIAHIKLNQNEVFKFRSEKIHFNTRITTEIFNENGILVKNNSTLKNRWRRIFSNFIIGNGEEVRSKTIALCKAKKIPVAEIYIPNFADACYDAEFLSNRYFFRKKIVSTPCYYLKNVAFLFNQNYWIDPDHLNSKGSCLFTDSIIKILPK